jgi:hypothetical protein
MEIKVSQHFPCPELIGDEPCGRSVHGMWTVGVGEEEQQKCPAGHLFMAPNPGLVRDRAGLPSALHRE